MFDAIFLEMDQTDCCEIFSVCWLSTSDFTDKKLRS